MINKYKFAFKINFWDVFRNFFCVESEYGFGLSLTITIFALEGVAIIFSNPVYTNYPYSVCVWPPFFSTPRHDRNSRLVSLEPVWPEECLSTNIFSKKWPMAKLPTEKNVPPMLFYGKNLALFVSLYEKQTFRKSQDFKEKFSRI